MIILVSGNPINGFSFTGPFENEERAQDYGESCNDSDWWTVEVNAP